MIATRATTGDEQKVAALAGLAMRLLPIVTFLPPLYNGNVPSDCEYVWVASGTGLVVATYGLVDWRPTDAAAFTLNTGGETQHAKVSRQNIATYAGPTRRIPSGPCDGLLNVNEGRTGIDGLDVPTAMFRCQTMCYVRLQNMTTAYIALLFSVTDCVNSSPFTLTADEVSLTFQPGGLQFLGARAAHRPGPAVRADLPRFAAAPAGDVEAAGPGVVRDRPLRPGEREPAGPVHPHPDPGGPGPLAAAVHNLRPTGPTELGE